MDFFCELRRIDDSYKSYLSCRAAQMLQTCTLLHSSAAAVVTSSMTSVLPSSAKQQSTDRDVEYIDDDGCLSWTELTDVLHIPSTGAGDGTAADTGVGTGAGVKDDADYFACCAEALAPFMKSVTSYVKSLMRNKRHADVKMLLYEKYQPYLQWMNEQQILRSCSELLSVDSSQTSGMLVVLLLTPVIERSLGNVYLLAGPSPRPSLLKDLLITAELQQTFGETVVQLLRVFLGPPTSLNLRNICWHGFAAPDEISISFGYFLYILCASLGRLLEDKQIVVDSVKQRDFVILPDPAKVNKEFTEFPFSGLTEVVACSLLVPSAMKSLWYLVLEFYESQRYYECMVIILPQLEVCLRRLFVIVNKREDRLQTADSAEYFTTFNEILSAKLPDGTENRLMDVLGRGMMELLFDVLLFPDGLRIRDLLSHGRISTEGVSQPVASLVLNLCFSLVTKWTSSGSDDPYRLCVNNYQSNYHPISILKQQLLELPEELNRLSDLQKPPEIHVDSVQFWMTMSEDELSSLHQYQIVSRLFCRVEKKVAGLAKLVSPTQSDWIPVVELLTSSSSEVFLVHRWSDRLPTVVAKFESEVFGILHKIVSCVRTVYLRIRTTADTRFVQHQNHELRQRQRITYIRMLNSIYKISSGLRTVFLVCVHQFTNFTTTEHNNTNTFSKHIRLYKSLLRYCERLYSNCDVTKNRWTESETLTDGVIEEMWKFYKMHEANIT